MTRWRYQIAVFAIVASLVASGISRAGDRALELPELPIPYAVGGQATAIWQYKPAFHSPYEGPHSLRGGTEDAISHSYTLYLGLRPFPWLDLFFDPEMVRGAGISDALGLAGFTNGEVIRNPAIGEDPYIARAFARLRIPLGEETVEPSASALELGFAAPARALEIVGGVLATNDLFDTNRYANSARTQFMNWALITSPAYDFAADTRGYSRGVAAAWRQPGLAVLAGVFQMPTVANGLELDSDVVHANGMQIELDREIPMPTDAAPLVFRALFYRNLARMGSYSKSLHLAREQGGAPVIEATRSRGRQKYGFCLNLEAPLADGGDTGLFARLGWNDGANESFAFTEAERNASIGAQIAGASWNRPQDRVGVAFDAEELGNLHASYLGAGGLGFILGDGRLNRRPEIVVETYYLLQILDWFAITLDYQLIANPGYNRDRGPVSVVSLRGHIDGFATKGDPASRY
ncbi:MAG TPA: carbohydrate porin [Candidatus Binatia bacterium]|nr:carbohydrate porin [Candidatus Binatia bacterium]